MTGVEILAMEEVVTKLAFNWTVCLIIGCGILFILSVIGVAIGIGTGDWSNLILLIWIGLVFGSWLGFLIGKATQKPTEYETQYKVTISDEVSMNDFLERYEIVDQEGKIYTVREIDND